MGMTEWKAFQYWQESGRRGGQKAHRPNTYLLRCVASAKRSVAGEGGLLCAVTNTTTQTTALVLQFRRVCERGYLRSSMSEFACIAWVGGWMAGWVGVVRGWADVGEDVCGWVWVGVCLESAMGWCSTLTNG